MKCSFYQELELKKKNFVTEAKQLAPTENLKWKQIRNPNQKFQKTPLTTKI